MGKLSRKLGLKIAMALVVTLVFAEVALHLFPALLPRSYRESFPMRGVELYHPGILERTPIEGLPLPLVVSPHEGPPSLDLKAMGLTPADERSDEERYPDLLLPADPLGFPNPREVYEAPETDVLLVGDSFGVAAGCERPPALRRMLAERLGKSVYNMSVAGIGPVREEWLLEQVGFARKPRAVVWLFFAGNDATATIMLDALAQKQVHDKHTYAEVYADRRVPSLRLAGLIGHAFRPRPKVERPDPLPGLRFPTARGPQELWFNPDNLWQLSWPRSRWEEDWGWQHAQKVLERVNARCREQGIAFLAVYVPTKAQVHLPLVEKDADLTHRMTLFGAQHPIGEDAEAFLQQALANRASLEQSFLAFCAAKKIEHLSATPGLEALARSGELGYLVADTHWQEVGQRTLLEPLVTWLAGLE